MRWWLAFLVLAVGAGGGCRQASNLIVMPRATPLGAAARSGDVVKTRVLLEAGDRPNVVYGQERWTALSAACWVGASVPTHGVAHTAKALSQFREKEGKRYAPVVALLLDHGADPTMGADHLGWDGTVLHAVAAQGSFHLVKALLDHGVSPDLRDPKGRTALHSVAGKHPIHLNPGVVRLLLDRGANVDAKDEQGMVPLHVAASSCIETTKALVEAGADVNAKDILGLTPLDYAATPEIEKLLREAGGKGLE